MNQLTSTPIPDKTPEQIAAQRFTKKLVNSGFKKTSITCLSRCKRQTSVLADTHETSKDWRKMATPTQPR